MGMDNKGTRWYLWSWGGMERKGKKANYHRELEMEGKTDGENGKGVRVCLYCPCTCKRGSAVPVSSSLSLATLNKKMPGSTTEHIGLINIHLSASTSLRLLLSLPPDTDTSHIYQTQICSPTLSM